MQDLNPNTLLTIRQAAHYLDCSIDTLKRWRRLNTGPKFERVGSRRLVRYRIEDLDAFIDAEMGVAK